MHGWEPRVLVRHYLEQGLSKAAIAERMGVNRRTLYYWLARGALGRGDAGRIGCHPCLIRRCWSSRQEPSEGAGMQFDRRTMMAGSAAAIIAAPAIARTKAVAGPGWYDGAVVIDALGGLADPYGPDDATRLSDRAWSEMVASGVTVLRDTILPVGNVE